MVFSRIKKLFGLGQKKTRFSRFIDSSGNFEMDYPDGWKYDPNIAIEDGKYTVSFASPDSQSTFTISVDGNLPAGFEFPKYARNELESPSAGIYAKAVRCRFHKMPAYGREYCYISGGRGYCGGGMMFHANQAVFSMLWNCPQYMKKETGRIFSHMMDSFVVKEVFRMRK
jgi:hypothetical protein